jgi:hypothetical protein
MSTRRQDRTIVGVLEVSCSSRCFFGFVRRPPAFVMSFVCLLLSSFVRSFVCLLSSVYKDRKVLVLSLVDNQLSSLLSTMRTAGMTMRAGDGGRESRRGGKCGTPFTSSTKLVSRSILY